MWYEKFITPSRLDMFAQYLTGELYSFGDRPEFSTEIFIDKILKLEDPFGFSKADAGTAVHEIIELSQYDVPIFNKIASNGWQVYSLANLSIQVPVVRECKVMGMIKDVYITGRVDSIDGVSIHDIKTTSKYDPEKYISSYQWKTYCLLTGLKRFIYDIITVKVDEDNKIVTLLDYNKVSLSIYPGMLQEVEELVTHYKDTLILLIPQIKSRIESFNKEVDETINLLGDIGIYNIVIERSIELLIKQLHHKKIIIEGI